MPNETEWEEKYSDKHKRKYWVNKVSKKTTWTEPLAVGAAAMTNTTSIETKESESEWEEKYSDKHKRKYWVNKETKKTTWTEPPKPSAAAGADTASAVPASVSAAPEWEWEEKYSDKHKRKYWVNKETKKTTWTEPPKPAATTSGASSASAVTSTAAAALSWEWEEKYSEKHKRKYWVNKETKKTTWTEPPKPSAVAEAGTSSAATSSAVAEPVSEWEEKYSDKHKRKYWVNNETKKTTWTEPPKAAAAVQAAAAESASATGATASAAAAAPSWEWEEKYSDKHKRKYWVNKETKKTTWEEPPKPVAVASATDTSASAAVAPVWEWEEKYSDKHKRKYWVNKATKKTTWEEPPKPSAAAAVVTGADTGTAAEVVAPLWEWEEKYSDKHKRKYWVNKATKKTTWEEPPKPVVAMAAVATGADTASAATAGAAAEPVSDWEVKYSDKHKRKYWVNKVTKKTTWEEPPKPVVVKPVTSDAVKDGGATNDEGNGKNEHAEEGVQNVELRGTDFVPLTEWEWEEKFSDQHNRKYWMDKNTKKTTWEEPKRTESVAVSSSSKIVSPVPARRGSAFQAITPVNEKKNEEVVEAGAAKDETVFQLENEQDILVKAPKAPRAAESRRASLHTLNKNTDICRGLMWYNLDNSVDLFAAKLIYTPGSPGIYLLNLYEKEEVVHSVNIKLLTSISCNDEIPGLLQLTLKSKGSEVETISTFKCFSKSDAERWYSFILDVRKKHMADEGALAASNCSSTCEDDVSAEDVLSSLCFDPEFMRGGKCARLLAWLSEYKQNLSSLNKYDTSHTEIVSTFERLLAEAQDIRRTKTTPDPANQSKYQRLVELPIEGFVYSEIRPTDEDVYTLSSDEAPTNAEPTSALAVSSTHKGYPIYLRIVDRNLNTSGKTFSSSTKFAGNVDDGGSVLFFERGPQTTASLRADFSTRSSLVLLDCSYVGDFQLDITNVVVLAESSAATQDTTESVVVRMRFSTSSDYWLWAMALGKVCNGRVAMASASSASRTTAVLYGALQVLAARNSTLAPGNGSSDVELVRLQRSSTGQSISDRNGVVEKDSVQSSSLSKAVGNKTMEVGVWSRFSLHFGITLLSVIADQAMIQEARREYEVQGALMQTSKFGELNGRVVVASPGSTQLLPGSVIVSLNNVSSASVGPASLIKLIQAVPTASTHRITAWKFPRSEYSVEIQVENVETSEKSNEFENTISERDVWAACSMLISDSCIVFKSKHTSKISEGGAGVLLSMQLSQVKLRLLQSSTRKHGGIGSLSLCLELKEVRADGGKGRSPKIAVAMRDFSRGFEMLKNLFLAVRLVVGPTSELSTMLDRSNHWLLTRTDFKSDPISESDENVQPDENNSGVNDEALTANKLLDSEIPVESSQMSSSKRGRDGRDGKTKHDIFVAAESLKSILHSFGLQTGREFPTAQLISARLLDLKKITTANHKMISKLVAMETSVEGHDTRNKSAASVATTVASPQKASEEISSITELLGAPDTIVDQSSQINDDSGNATKAITTEKLIPAELEGVPPLVSGIAKPVKSDIPRADSTDKPNVAESILPVSDQDNSSSSLDVENADAAGVLDALKEMLVMSEEEDGYCCQLVCIIRQFPEIILGMASSLGAETSQKLARICVNRLFNRWSCDAISIVGLIEAAGNALVGSHSPDASSESKPKSFLQHLLCAICENIDVTSFGRCIAQGSCMQELEFLLNHPSNELSVQTVCKLTVEPMFQKLIESINSQNSYSTDNTQFGGVQTTRIATISPLKGGITQANAHSAVSPGGPPNIDSSVPPLLLRCAIVGLNRSLGQTRALFELAAPFCCMLLKSLVAIQQRRHTSVLAAAGVNPLLHHSGNLKAERTDNGKLSSTSVVREDPVLLPGRDSLKMLFPDGDTVDPSTLSAGDKEVSVLFRVYSLSKLCFTWMKQDRGNFCLSEMAILSRSRFLVTSFVAKCKESIPCVEILAEDNVTLSGGARSSQIPRPTISPVASLVGMFDRSIDVGFLSSSGSIKARSKVVGITRLRQLKPKDMVSSVAIPCSELSFLLDRMAILFGRSSVIEEPEAQQPPGISFDASFPGQGSQMETLNFPGQVCRDLLLSLSEFRRKLNSIPNCSYGSVAEFSARASISTEYQATVSHLTSDIAVKYKQGLVYTIPSRPVRSADPQIEDLVQKNVESGNANTLRNAFHKTAGARKSNELIEGYGFDFLSTAQSNSKERMSYESSTTGEKSLSGIIMAEELSSLSWIINASRAALAHVYVDEVARSDITLAPTFHDNFMVWKEIVDLKHSLSERKGMICDVFADFRKFDEYINLCKLYGSEIGLCIEKMTHKMQHIRPLSEDYAESPRSTSDGYYCALLERCSAQQIEYELALPSNTLFQQSKESTFSNFTEAQKSHHERDGISGPLSPLSNPLKILMQSVFPVTELRPTAN